MIKFGKEKVMLLHRLLVEETGGEDAAADRSQPHAAVRKNFCQSP